MTRLDLVLVLANLLYATSYVASRTVLAVVPPATLALVRLAIGSLILILSCRGRVGLAGRAPVTAGDRWRIAAMGVVGFAAAFALSHWGILRSTATNAALLIIVEPISVMLLSPALLRERLSRREGLAAVLALAGTVLVVVNGMPGVSERLVPHWRGDTLLILAGLAYGSYTLFGRDVLLRHDPLRVTAQSILWGLGAMVPVAALEASAATAIAWTVELALGVAYLSVVITALGYLLWNWILARVPAPRAAIFLSLQPIAGALLGVIVLGEAFTVYTMAGAALIVTGLLATVYSKRG